MGLHVLAGPGCDAVGKDAYADAHMGPDDVKISVGSIYKALTGSDGIPSDNTAALRLALYLRTTAISQARKQELSGFVLTSNGNRRDDLDRLVRETGSPGVLVLKMSASASLLEDRQARARQARVVRRAPAGVRARWFGRYTPGPDDREVTP